MTAEIWWHCTRCGRSVHNHDAEKLGGRRRACPKEVVAPGGKRKGCVYERVEKGKT
jgi:hypothetical protein